MRRLFFLNPALVDTTFFDLPGFLGEDDIHAVIQRQYKLLRSGRLIHASYFWTGRGTQQGTLAAHFPVPDLPGMTTPPYNDSGSRDGLLLYEFNNVSGSSLPTPDRSPTR